MNAPPNFARPNRFEIDLEAVANCVRKIRDTIGPATFFFATLKANAYGYGLLPVAKTVVAAGADAISLVTLDDAVALRKAGIRVPIMVYAGSVPDEHIVKAAENYDLIPTLHSDESLDAYARLAVRQIKVAVKLEVGPERIGVVAEDAVRFVKAVAGCPNLKLHVLNAHPNVPAHGRADDVLKWQFERYMRACTAIERAGIQIPYKVVASSKVLRLAGQSMVLNAVDPGAALFSAFEPGESAGLYQPFRTLTSRLIQVRTVTRTHFVDEAPFAISPGMRVGIIPIGYSDGMHRLHCGEVLVRGARAPILAAPALEYTRIDLTGIADAAVGDEVAIVGAQNGERITPEEVVKKQKAARVSDLALEVRPTIPRVYFGE